MLRGILTRAAVVVFMVGTLLAPFGTCLSVNQKAEVNVCMPAKTQSETAQPNRIQSSVQHAASPALPDASPMAIVEGIVPVDELIVLRDFLTSALVAPRSTSVGSFDLKI